MTNLWSNSLPVELLQCILLYVTSELYLDDRDIFQSIQVCKSWKYTAQVIGYSRISLYKPSQIESMEQSTMTNYSYPPGRYVKSVYFETQPHNHYLPIIAVLFPLVEHIDTFSLDVSFYETLITLHRQFKLTQLKSFSPQYIYVSLISFSRYAECAIEYNSTLTKFECRGRDSLEEVTRDEYFVECFPHLQELSIYYTDYQKGLTINSFDSIIDGFKNLKSFKFETYYIYSNTNPINTMIQPQPGIERLVARMPITNNDDILDYILHKFPKLKELHLANNRNAYYGYKDKCLLARIVKFFEHVSASVPKYDI